MDPAGAEPCLGASWSAAARRPALCNSVSSTSNYHHLPGQHHSSVLRSSVGRSRWSELLHILDAKVTSSGDRDLLTAVKSFNGTPDQLRLDSTIRKLAYGESK